MKEGGIPWWFNGYGSMLLLQGARVQSLVRELRSCRSCGTAKNKQTNKQNEDEGTEMWKV